MSTTSRPTMSSGGSGSQRGKRYAPGKGKASKREGAKVKTYSAGTIKGYYTVVRQIITAACAKLRLPNPCDGVEVPEIGKRRKNFSRSTRLASSSRSSRRTRRSGIQRTAVGRALGAALGRPRRTGRRAPRPSWQLEGKGDRLDEDGRRRGRAEDRAAASAGRGSAVRAPPAHARGAAPGTGGRMDLPDREGHASQGLTLARRA
jgi:hypothetical protein